jgi:hypothetical protein
MIEGFENITFKNSVIKNIEKPVLQSEKECNECDGRKGCWYKELEMRCCEMRG